MNDYNPCGMCGDPKEGHNTRYVALFGDHTFQPASGQVNAPAHETSQTPATIPHPAGGITIAIDPTDPTGSRLSPAVADTNPARPGRWIRAANLLNRTRRNPT